MHEHDHLATIRARENESKRHLRVHQETDRRFNTKKKSRDRYTLTTSLPYTQLYNTPPQSKVRHLSKSCVYVQRAQPHTHFSSSNTHSTGGRHLNLTGTFQTKHKGGKIIQTSHSVSLFFFFNLWIFFGFSGFGKRKR